MAVKIGTLPTRQLYEAFLTNIEACRNNGVYRQQLAALLSIPQDVIYKMLEWSEQRGRPHIFFWPDRIARLIEVSGNASYLAALADCCDYFLVPKPKSGDATYAELAESIQSNARMVGKVADMLRDGIVDRQEAEVDVPEALRLIDECQRDLEGLRAKLVDERDRALAGPKTIKAADRFGRPGK